MLGQVCRYFGYFLATWGLCLGTFYAYMLYDVITSVRSITQGPLGSLGSLLGGLGGDRAAPSSSFLPPPVPTTTTTTTMKPPLTLDESKANIHQFINQKMKDMEHREKYLREFLPDCGLTDLHFKEMNLVLEGIQFETLKEYEAKLGQYMREKIKDLEIRKKALAKLDDFAKMSVDLDQSIENLAQQLMKEEL
ncbi:hypothetical protein M3Y99_01833600 [Aphelenchoides fujianensis]|nr:hypothetical protein M3Y99_01833600 [Aphelenchoides fujianensis]